MAVAAWEDERDSRQPVSRFGSGVGGLCRRPLDSHDALQHGPEADRTVAHRPGAQVARFLEDRIDLLIARIACVDFSRKVSHFVRLSLAAGSAPAARFGAGALSMRQR